VNVPPEGLDEGELPGALAASWGLDVDTVRYLPEGFGSYHWRANTLDGAKYFLTVDDLDHKLWLGTNRESTFTGLTAAFDTAADLREHADLEFVVPPIRTRDGDTLVRISSQYSLAVFPYIDGRGGRWGEEVTAVDRTQLVRLLADLHQSTPTVVSTAPHYGVSLPERAELEAALRDVDRPWTGGPFSEPARQEVAKGAEAVSESLRSFDRLAEDVAKSEGDQVVTHGEPHPGNLIRAGGRFLLIDWDTVGVAPAERDLWMLDEPANENLQLYTDLTGRKVHEAAISLYRLSWTLKDLATYVVQFRSNHQRTEDTEKAWSGLTQCLRCEAPVTPWGSS
jgi:spectinomycin phosphotransferase